MESETALSLVQVYAPLNDSSSIKETDSVVLNKISHKDLYIMAISMEELGEKEPGMNTGQLL